MEYDASNEEHRELMEYLVSEGAAIIDGMDEDGELVYRFDMEVLDEVMPELYQVLVNDMDQVLIDLYKKGLIEVSYDEELNAQMSISEEGKKILIENGFDLDGSEDYGF
jgi:Tfp pilus assembly ATPase PilU